MVEQFNYEEVDSYIVIFDALGAADYNADRCIEFLKDRDHSIDVAVDIIKALEQQYYEKAPAHKDELQKLFVGLHPKVYTFGDSILCIWRAIDSYVSQVNLLAHLSSLILGLMAIKGHFLRGALSRGICILDGFNTAIGPAVAETARLHDKHKMVGVVVGHSLDPEISRITKSKLLQPAQNLFIQYDVPFDSMQCNMWTIAWPYQFEHSLTREALLSKNQLSSWQCIQDMFDKHYWGRGIDKKKNTVKYCDFLRKIAHSI